jgi:hypothetical protein
MVPFSPLRWWELKPTSDDARHRQIADVCAQADDGEVVCWQGDEYEWWTAR